MAAAWPRSSRSSITRKNCWQATRSRCDSTVLEVKDKVLRFSHEMRNAQSDEVAATTVLTGVFLDTAARKAVPFPAETRARIQALTNVA